MFEFFCSVNQFLGQGEGEHVLAVVRAQPAAADARGGGRGLRPAAAGRSISTSNHHHTGKLATMT